MLQPVGKLPPAVYWRRRLIFLVLPGLLVLLLVAYLFSGGGSAKKAATSTATSSRPAAGPPVPKTALTTAITAGTASSTPTPAPTPTSVRFCTAADRKVQATTGQPSYVVGTKPVLYLVVTNISSTPCRQDLADKQIQLTISIGDVRVWGSHDCMIEPGVAVATLRPKVAVRRGIVWSGQTSALGCVGQRLIAQAGSYELIAILAGQSSVPTPFALTATG